MSDTLIFTLLGRDKLSPAFQSAGKSADKAHSKFAAIGKVGKVAATGVAAAGAAMVVLAPKVFTAAASMEQLQAKAATVFGSQLGAVEKWSKANAAAMGLTAKQATGLAANFGDLVVPMGFTREAAAKMSTQVIGLSGALSQWSGGTRSAAEVAGILTKAMLGERDELKSLGISISEAEVDAALLAKGQDKLTGAARQQAEATATQALIFAKSKDAQAAYAKGGDTLLGKQAKLTAQFKTVGEVILTKLTPPLSAAMGFIVDKGIPAVQGLTSGASKFMPTIRAVGSYIAETLFPVLRIMAERWLEAARGALDRVRTALRDNAPELRKLAKGIGVVVAWIADKLGPILGWLAGTQMRFVGRQIANVITAIGGMVRAVAAISRAVSDAAATIGRKWAEIKAGAATLLTFFGNLPGAIARKMGDVRTTLRTKGLEIIAGFFGGMIAKWKDVTKWVGGIATWIKEHKGPVALDKQLLIPAGRAIMDGFLKGLQSGAGPAWRFVQSVGGKTVAALRDSLGSAVGIGQPIGGPRGNQSNVGIVRTLAAQRGWGTGSQWNALHALIMGESGFRNTAQNPTSSAYGLFQFLDSTWASVGARKTSDPWQQTLAGLTYIARSYGNPLNAYSKWASRSPHWYDEGGWLMPGATLAYNGTGRPEAVLTNDQLGHMFGGPVRLHPDDIAAIVDGMRRGRPIEVEQNFPEKADPSAAVEAMAERLGGLLGS